MKTASEALKQTGAGGNENNIIDVQKKICKFCTAMKNEEGHVGDGSHKSDGANIRGKSLVPSMRCMFKAIQGFVETTNVVRESKVDKTERVLTVHRFIKSAMEKGVLDIELVNQPRA